MGRTLAIGGIIVTVLIILAGVYMWTKRHDFKGDLSQAEEKHMRELVSEAAMIFTAMRQVRFGDALDMDLLTPGTTKEIDQWMSKYQKNRKEFERA